MIANIAISIIHIMPPPPAAGGNPGSGNPGSGNGGTFNFGFTGVRPNPNQNK